MNDDAEQVAYSLRKAIHEVMDSTDLASPEEIAAKVAESVPVELLRVVLTEALREFVRFELSRSRALSNTAAASGRSAKVAAIRSAAPGWLRERVNVGSDWKLLGDCTVDDLRWLEGDRAGQADRLRAASERYARLADLLASHRKRRVADLPRKVLAQFEAGS